MRPFCTACAVQATTATVCVASDERVDVAWVGDSRCVLATTTRGKKKVVATPLTSDHRPDDPLEKARVKALGGGCGRNEKEAFATPKQALRAHVVGAHVVFNLNRKSAWRVFPGGIAVTRALGARPLKTAEPQLVIATPSVASHTLDGTEAFVIVACDGVWDVLSDQQAADFVHAAISRADAAGARPEATVAEQLVKQAHAKGSTDNISAVVLQFDKVESRVDSFRAAGLEGVPETKE